MIECSIADCRRPVSVRGWCDMHYRRWKRRGGDPAVTNRNRPPGDAFADRWVLAGECWRWIGNFDTRGYPRAPIGGQRAVRAHRLSYELFVGAIPSGLEIDHLCRNTWCVNPAHLEPVTGAENRRREWEARKA